MTPHLIAQNIGYLIGFSALAVRDILWLRNLMIVAQFLATYYAYATNNMYSVFWHCLFIGMNSIQVVRVVRERRPVPIPESLQDIASKKFTSMTTREFLNFWNIGDAHSFVNEPIIKDGSFPEKVALIVSGTVEVRKHQHVVNKLSRSRFVGEMSYLSNKSASAEVFAVDQVDVICWQIYKLKQLEKTNPALLQKFHSIIGEELAEKIRETSSPASV